MRRACLALIAGTLLLPAPGGAALLPRGAVTTDEEAEALVLAQPKVKRWMERYPRRAWVTTGRFSAKRGVWEVGVYSGKAGQTAAADVDRAGRVVKAWVGPEVAWPLARGEGSEARSTGRSSGWRSASSS